LTSSTVYTLGGEAAKTTLPKFSSQIIVNAKREHVFDVFSNYGNYQELVPQHFPSVRIRSVRGELAVVEEHFNLGALEMIVMARHVSKNPIFHEVFIIGGDAKGSHIKQEFIELENGTKVLIDADFKFKGKMKLSHMFGKSPLMQDYDVILNDFAKIAES
jgi:hypothetical protein